MSDPVPKNAKSTKSKLEMFSQKDTKRSSKISTAMPTVNSHFLIASEKLDKLTRRVIAPYAQIERKGQKSEERKGTYLDINRFNVFLDDTVDLDSLLYETAMVLKTITRSSGVFVYSVNSLKNEIVLMPHYTKDPGRHEVNVPIVDAPPSLPLICKRCSKTSRHTVTHTTCAHRHVFGFNQKHHQVATTTDSLSFDDGLRDESCITYFWSSGIGKNTVYTVLSMACWAGAAVHQAQARVTLQKKSHLNAELIALLQSYFCDVASIDTMLTDMLQVIKSFLGAMRSTFYIIDRDHVGEFIQADMWDDGWTSEKSTIPRKRAKVNLSVEKSPASTVATLGKFLNIADAYKDSRFSKEIDPTTGAVMRSCMAAPILDKNGVIGVVQVTNKTNGQPFDDQDELIYNVFINYCALIVYFYRMESKKQFHENLNIVQNDLIRLHMKPCRHDVEELMETNGVILPPSNFRSFDFHFSDSSSREDMPGLICYMFIETFADRKFDKALLADFTLTALSAYRPNPYHNADHAFCFTHTMFLILVTNNGYFDFFESAALMLGGLCHDIDHPGLNNNFLTLVKHPLATMYHASTLEHHHAYLARHLVENKNILGRLSVADKERILEEMNYAILCTDLAVYFQIRARLTPIVADRNFDWTNGLHRKMLKGIMMTTCDLSGNCKPFGITKRIAENVYDEFYKQGDMERNLGYTPLSMMDRRRRVNQPAEQIQFLSVVVLPSLLLLQSVFPNTQQLIDNCKKSQESWREEIEIRGQKLWRQEDSLFSVNRSTKGVVPAPGDAAN